jgi:hypothetical protein
METIEKLHIYNLRKRNQHLNDNYTITNNPICNTVITQN